MKNISQLDKAFSDYVTRLKAKLEEAQLHATEYMLEEAKERIEIPSEARNTQQFVDYSNSIKMRKPETQGNTTISKTTLLHQIQKRNRHQNQKKNVH